MKQPPKFPVSTAKVEDLHRRMVVLGLKEDDLVESYFKTVRSGGKAGLIGVMLFHPASGVRVRCRRERSQGINRFLARRLLVDELETRWQKTAREAVSAVVRPLQDLSLPPAPAHWSVHLEAQSLD